MSNLASLFAVPFVVLSAPSSVEATWADPQLSRATRMRLPVLSCSVMCLFISAIDSIECQQNQNIIMII